MSEQALLPAAAWYLIAAAVILLLPLAEVLLSWYSARRADGTEAAKIWLDSRRLARAVRLSTVALWWATWDLRNQSALMSLPRILLFWAPPIASIGISHVIACLASRAILNQRWTTTDILRLAWWNTVSPTIALLFVAMGFEFIYEKHLTGILWLVVAGIAALIGDMRLRSAEGVKLRRVKSGKAYTRAFQLAKKMGVRLERVYVVPAGRGHLTNAYGLWRGIAVTDNYGEFLHEPQLDYAIGHELAHVKKKHGRKKLLVTLLLFSVPTLMLFTLPSPAFRFRPVVDLVLVLGPALTFYFSSRCFEYAADRESVELTHDPEMAIRALASLYRTTATPADCSRLLELFLTHPCLTRRAAAIAHLGKMSPDHVNEILGRAGLLKTELPETPVISDQHPS